MYSRGDAVDPPIRTSHQCITYAPIAHTVEYRNNMYIVHVWVSVHFAYSIPRRHRNAVNRAAFCCSHIFTTITIAIWRFRWMNCPGMWRISLWFDVGIYVSFRNYGYYVCVHSISTDRVNSFHRGVASWAQMCSRTVCRLYVLCGTLCMLVMLSLMLIVNLTLVKIIYLRYVHSAWCVRCECVAGY